MPLTTHEYQSAHDQGFNAYYNYHKLTENPYPHNSPEHKAWKSGWLTAENEDNPVLETADEW